MGTAAAATEKKVQVLDCSIRDGGLMNRWNFDPAFVGESVAAAVQVGVDYVEPGYKADAACFDPREYGIWRFCPEQALRGVWGERKLAGRRGSKLSVMIDIGRFDLASLPPAADSVVSTYRVACYVHQIPEAIATGVHLAKLGYESFVNIMAVSEAAESELAAGLRRIAADSPARGVYVVDSYGNLNPASTRELVGWYASLCGGKEIGFHGHNNQQLALANTLAAIEAGATLIDASLYGMGRGAGNCHLELLLAQLGRGVSELAPLFSVIDRHVVLLRERLRWGYSLPYALAGIANQHPKRAMAIMDARQGVLDSGYLDELIAGVAI